MGVSSVRVLGELTVISEIENRSLECFTRICSMLSEILIEAVANGGSVSFMHPLEPEKANAFWDDALVAATREERIILGAWDGEGLVGTVTLLLDCPSAQSAAPSRNR
jgi:hypothetical protein